MNLRTDRSPERRAPGRRCASRMALASAAMMAGAALPLPAAGSDLTAPEATVGVSLALVTDVAAIRPGVPFRAGVLIRHQPGFHTYWKAPGIVGLPTSLEWTLPEGFQVGPLQWPYPERTLMYHYRCYGYERDTLLHATVSPPPDLEPGTTVSLGAMAAWMACAETCHPGSAGLRTTLPVASPDAPPPPRAAPRGALFDQAAAEVPEPIELADAAASREGRRLTLRFTVPDETLPPEGQPFHFYSADNLADPNVAQEQALEAGDEDGRTRVVLRVEIMPEAPEPLPDRLRGLLENPAGWPGRGGGAGRFGRIDLPLEAAAPSGDSP